jgi:membrane associated rhomboid family serine protease
VKNAPPFGSLKTSIVIPALLLIVLWIIQWGNMLFPNELVQWGVLPRSLEGLKGIVLMPFIHSEDDVRHLINNSMPIFVLLFSLLYFYRSIAGKVLILGWILTGTFLWAYAKNHGAYHIGISGIIYFLAAFLFASGVLRKYLPLQAISLFVVFAYGSMLWGILPLKTEVSWEGHFAGLSIGTVLAYMFREKGPQRPKYQYEIEKELGIEPPDLEARWEEKVRLAQQKEEENQKNHNGQVIVYHYVPEKKDEPNQ